MFNSNCYTYVVLAARTSIVDTLFWFVSWAIQSSSAFGTFNFLSLYWPFRILSWNLDFLYSIKSIWHIWKAIWFFIISCRVYFTYYVVRNVGLTNPSDLGLRKTWTVYRDNSPRDLHIMTLLPGIFHCLNSDSGVYNRLLPNFQVIKCRTHVFPA